MDEREHRCNLSASAAEKRIAQNVKLVSTSTNENCTSASDESPRRSSSNHLVFVNQNHVPYPKSYEDRWDGDHVRLPCSPQNVFSDESTWDRMRRSFTKPVLTAIDLEKIILSANPELDPLWHFKSLTTLLTDVVDEAERERFFAVVFPALIDLALRLPLVCTRPIPLLVCHRSMSLTFSQNQIGCLLANAFLCTFPRRSVAADSEYRFYPSINFGQLFASTRGPRSRVKMEKIRCLINYFARITSCMPKGLVTFRRRFLSLFPNWSESSSPLGTLLAHSQGSIEEDGVGLLQVDFANKRVGGGVLNTGCVQEEIRFVLFPELILARLFTQCLDDGEVLLATGCERFNSHSGYGDDFYWAGDYRDSTPFDSWGRRKTMVVAVDATRFTLPEEQYGPDKLLRELNKLFCAFHRDEDSQPIAVATGNWGCGAFRGDARLKALLQLMAASEAGRDIVYFTFGDVGLCNELNEMCRFLHDAGVTVGKLWNILLTYYDYAFVKGNRIPIYQYIYKSLNDTKE